SEAEFNLELFAEKWDKQYPSISKSWRSHWAHIIPFFAFPSEIRRAIYTTNAIELMNSSLRKVIKSQQIFPSDEAAFKLVYLALRNISIWLVTIWFVAGQSRANDSSRSTSNRCRRSLV
ncbi:MAG: transposase, partial [Pseudanabaena sp.]